MNYYVYRITNLKLRKHYYGKRQCKAAPKEDLGIKYFSSSKDPDFIKDQKINQKDYRYKVIAIFDNDKDALAKEIKLHQKLQVDINPSFYNRSIQTSDKWSTTGKVIVKDRNGTALCVPKNHPDYLAGKLVGINTNRVWSKRDKEKMSLSRRGANNGNSIFVTIYKYSDNTILAENVLVSVWCKENNYNQAHLAKTVYANRNNPSSKSNPHQHKGVYAKRYIPVN